MLTSNLFAPTSFGLFLLLAAASAQGAGAQGAGVQGAGGQEGGGPSGDASASQVGQAPVPATDLHLPDGFEAELLFTVPRDEMGSWVCLARDDRGGLFASDQGGKGIYRITPAPIDGIGVTVAEKLPTEVSGAQGLLWAFDSLYANVNGQGLWRIRDTDGDGEPEDATHLVKLGNGGEHGPHAVLPTRDGKGIYFIAGNHTLLPEIQGSRAPSNWGEDLLLPRQWDARGHARGRLAPGGWIASSGPDGEDIEVVSSGYRNQYDIAINDDGEMFTYDADMEWDVGMPWYRPTRICHATSGSEFGWRSGTGKWPEHYEDSLPPTYNIGPGSPTGLLFGTGAKFPARYQRALYALDWTFGTIYAFELVPDGASYRAVRSEFAWSKPLGVTDATIGADGAMYFTVGGRGAQSALYRVTYTGAESTAPVSGADPEGAEARALRRSLEAFHGAPNPAALDAAWGHLGSQDRFIRFAARIAVENQEVSSWVAAALAESAPRAATTALLALARQGREDDMAPLLARGLELWDAGLGGEDRLTLLRAFAVAMARNGGPERGLRAELAKRLVAYAAAGPADGGSAALVDVEVARLLTYLGEPRAVTFGMEMVRAPGGDEELPLWVELLDRNDRYGPPIKAMITDRPPIRGMEVAFILRNAEQGWTPELRREYFAFLNEAAGHSGGASYPGFLENMRADAADRLTVKERQSLAELLGLSLVAGPPEGVTPPKGPGRKWTTQDAVAAVEGHLTDRDFAAGVNLYHATSCSSCHMFAGKGGAIGPDLSTVGNKFALKDLLECVIEPSLAISDQYGSQLLMDHEGNIAEGIVVEEGDEYVVYPRDPGADALVFHRDEVKVLKESKVSQMPEGLVDGLNVEELRDLVAVLLSGGNKKAKYFKQ